MARPRLIGEMGLALDCACSCAVQQIEDARGAAQDVCKGQMRAGDDRQEGLAFARRQGRAYVRDARPEKWQRKRVAGGRRRARGWRERLSRGSVAEISRCNKRFTR